MSLYKALIDFRDNDNDPMWIRQEDTDDIVRVRSVNKTKRGKSLLFLDFDNMKRMQKLNLHQLIQPTVQ